MKEKRCTYRIRFNFLLVFMLYVATLTHAQVRNKLSSYPGTNNYSKGKNSEVSAGTPCDLPPFTYQNTGVHVNLNGVTTDPWLNITVVGDSGRILYSPYGGQIWGPQVSGTTENLLSISYLDQTNGIIVGERGTILHTGNGGQTWTRMPSGVTATLRSVVWIPYYNAVAVGDSGTILFSGDGGYTWHTTPSNTTSRLTGVSFSSDLQNGIIVGWDGVYLRTSDGGYHWGLWNMSPESRYLSVCYGNYHNLAVIEKNTATGESIYRTSWDWGMSWHEYPYPPNPGNSDSVGTILMVDSYVYAAVGNMYCSSSDGGQSWHDQEQFKGGSIRGINSTPTLVCDGGVIIRKSDSHWPGPLVSLITPPNNSQNVLTDGGVVFSWHSYTGGTIGDSIQYGFQLSKNLGLNCPSMVADTFITDTTITINNLQKGTSHYWRVIAAGTRGQTDNTGITKFTTETITVDQPASLISPTNGSADLHLEMDLQSNYVLPFSWHRYPNYIFPDSSVGTASMHVQIGIDSTFTSGMVVDQVYSPNDTAKILIPFQLNTKYYWRARPAFNVAVVAPWSATWSFTSSATPKPYPSFVRISPANGASTYPEQMKRYDQSLRIRFNWQPYPIKLNQDGSQETPTYLMQFANDSLTVAQGKGTLRGYASAESLGHTFSNYGYWLPFKMYYWRMRAGYTIGGSQWSDVWSFTGIGTPSTIQKVQQVNQDSLLIADSQQKHGSPSLQRSYQEDSLLTLTVRCIVPPGILTKDSLTMIVCDTGDVSQPWHSIIAHIFYYNNNSPIYNDYNVTGLGMDGYLNLLNTFPTVHKGDLLTISGFPMEDPPGNIMSNTVFNCMHISILGSSDTTTPVYQSNVSDFYLGGNIHFSTAEQYEGSIVELRHVTVHAILDAGRGIFDITDGAGNIISTTDLSCWFTLAGHRNPASTYTLPHPGAHINVIRGVITTTGGKYCISPILPGEIDLAPDPPHTISGFIYYKNRNIDENQDTITHPLSQFPITLSGKVLVSVFSDTNGMYAYSGLDSGSYTISCQTPQKPYDPQVVITGPTLYTFTTAPETVHVQFGLSRPWNRISGTLFRDINENGEQDYGEPGLANWTVKITGANSDSTVTDVAGNYLFKRVDRGLTYVSASIKPDSEQIYPRWWEHYAMGGDSLGNNYQLINFAVHQVPSRIKLLMIVHDNSYNVMQKLYWGNRAGATYGIWGTNPNASNIDFSEGETELPPTSYPLYYHFFDARFQDPHRTSNQFGEGSWVDMRNFYSPAQVDTHLVVFLPGYNEGGDYPMTISWNHNDVNASYSGDVSFVDSLGTTTNMKTSDSLIITNRNIRWLLLISHDPTLPQTSSTRWRLFSIPGILTTGNIADVIPFVSSYPYWYDPSTGYKSADLMNPGIGYWLKYLDLDINTASIGAPRPLPETLSIKGGWNLVGAANIPLSIYSLTSVPPFITGKFFAYNQGYQPADTLKPYQGYWVKASQDGLLIVQGAQSKNPFPPLITEQKASIIFKNADVILQTLELNSGEVETNLAGNLSRYEMPPIPPAGISDIRFASGRYLELIPSDKFADYPIRLSGNIKYPLSIEYHSSKFMEGFDVSVKKGSKLLSLCENGAVIVNDAHDQLILHVNAKRQMVLPKEYSLEQNYPNPFNPVTVIHYSLPAASKVHMVVYNVLGQVVKTLVDEIQDGG
ncbi:MAG: SdrD B-like domain-containing protein, partial [Bacteroidota bacterium]